MHLGGLGMNWTKYKVGSLLETVDERNNLGIRDFYGVNIDKEFMPTAANTTGLDESKYKLMRRNRFVYSGMQTGRDECIRISMYNHDAPILVSPAYTTFEVKSTDLLISEYLFMYFLSKEKDRYGAFCSDGSIRSNLDWDAFCDIEIMLPPISIQKKYVDIYNALLKNQQCYESGLNDLKLTCDAYIENLRHSMVSEEIGNYIVRQNNKNIDNKIKTVLGLSTSKEFRVPQSRVNKKNLGGYKIVKPFEFAFVPTTDTWKVLAFAINIYNEPIVVSPIYEVFSVCAEKLLPEYLALWLSREEFDRYARFHSWGSARENFSWDAMCDVRIPIPDIEVQRSIVDIYKVYNIRKEINEKLKAQLKDICPILIKGSIEEAKKLRE